MHTSVEIKTVVYWAFYPYFSVIVCCLFFMGLEKCVVLILMCMRHFVCVSKMKKSEIKSLRETKLFQAYANVWSYYRLGYKCIWSWSEDFSLNSCILIWAWRIMMIRSHVLSFPVLFWNLPSSCKSPGPRCLSCSWLLSAVVSCPGV